jgi:hypothetical protein
MEFFEKVIDLMKERLENIFYKHQEYQSSIWNH